MPIRWHVLWNWSINIIILYVLLEWLSPVGIILGIRIIILCIAVSIDSLLTGVSTILTGRVTYGSHGFVYNYYVLLSISFDRQPG